MRQCMPLFWSTVLVYCKVGTLDLRGEEQWSEVRNLGSGLSLPPIILGGPIALMRRLALVISRSLLVVILLESVQP